MAAKNTVLAVAVILGCSISAEAEEIETYKTLEVSCNPFSTLSSQCKSDLAIKSETNKVAQNRRRRGRVRDRNRKIDSFYAGFSLGAGFPDGGIEFANEEAPPNEYNNSFVGSLFAGLKFSKNLSADAEFLLGLGGINTDGIVEYANDPNNGFNTDGSYESEGNYSAFAFYLNPRFELPLNSSGSFSFYLSPGIGISQTIVTLNSEDSAVQFQDDLDLSNTSFTYQVKGGASYSISNTIGLFAQLRYVSLGTDEGDIQFPDDINFFSTEVGMKFNLF